MPGDPGKPGRMVRVSFILELFHREDKVGFYYAAESAENVVPYNSNFIF